MLSHLRIYFPVVITLVAGALLSLGLFYFVNQSESRVAREEIRDRARSFQEQFRQSIRQHLILLEATDAFYISSENVSEEEFNKFGENLIKDRPEIISVQFIARQKLVGHEQVGRGNYKYILERIVHESGDNSSLGIDVATISHMKHSLEEAEIKSAPIMTRHMKAFEEDERDDEADDIYLIYPLSNDIVRRNAPHADRGFLIMGLDVKVVIQEYASLDIFKGMHIRVKAQTEKGKETIFSNTDFAFPVFHTEDLSVMSQNYEFEYGLKAGRAGADFSTYIILCSGIFLTLLLSANIYTWRRQLLKDQAAKQALNKEIREKENLYSQIKEAQTELQERRVLLQTILDNMPLGIFAKDAKDDYRWLLLNKMAEKMFLLKQDQVVGKTDYDYFPKEEADFFRTTDKDVMAGGKVFEIEAEPVTTANNTFMAHTIKVPIYEADGSPSILLGIFEDVTERIKFLEELRIAKEQAELASVAKSDFLANMSHELRTPLNSILGMNRLLLESDLRHEHRELADSVFRSSVNLLEIVNDILDLSKIESGEMELEKIGFDISYTFYSVIHSLKHLAMEKHIELRKEYDADALPYVVGDPLRMTQIITNVISNAIKYTDHGHVDFKAFCHQIGESKVTIICEITDTGIGIPEDKLDRIFEKFGQADTSTTRKYGGTGLGLTITRQLVDLMGGNISVKSEPNQGSTFIISIPFDTTDELSSESRIRRKRSLVGTIPAAAARILIAEDHPANQLLIKKILHKFGINNFVIVATGKEALEKFKEEDWDILLMDCHMPEMNGYDTTLAIRALESESDKAALPIVAMTANAMVGEREKCLRCGMNDYISKPMNIDELKEILGQWIIFEGEIHIENTLSSDQSAPIDFSLMRTFTDGDQEVEKELIGVFIEESDKNVASLGESYALGGHAWVEAAHMMKGGAGSIGAFSLQALCNKAQNFSGNDEGRHILFDKILDEYNRVKAYLKEKGLLL